MSNKWLERAALNKEANEKRKRDIELGIAQPYKRNVKQARDLAATTKPPRKDVQSIAVADLSWREDVKCGSVKKMTCNLGDLEITEDNIRNKTKPNEPKPSWMSLTNAKHEPLVVQFSGGGSVPSMYGVSPAGNSGDYNCKFILDDFSECKKMKKFDDDIQSYLVGMAGNVYPTGCNFTHAGFYQRIYTNPIEKKNKSGEFWPASLRTKLKNVHDKSADAKAEMSIVKDDHTPILVMDSLAGMDWRDLKIEIKTIMFGWTWSDDRKRWLPQVRVLTNLRRATMIENCNTAHLVYPHQEEAHAAQHCARRHHCPVDILRCPSRMDEFVLEEPRLNAGGGIVMNVERKDNTKFILKIRCDGVLPIEYAVGENSHKDPTLTVSFNDDAIFNACDQLAKQFASYLLEHRSVFYRDSTSPDDTVLSYFKPLLKPKSKTSESNSRMITAICDYMSNGSTLMLVDENDQLVMDPDQFIDQKFTEIWYNIIGIYANSKGGGSYESGFIKRVAYLKLAPKRGVFSIDGQ